jgi:hypothetical protein
MVQWLKLRIFYMEQDPLIIILEAVQELGQTVDLSTQSLTGRTVFDLKSISAKN